MNNDFNSKCIKNISFSTVTFSNCRLLSEGFKLRQKKIKYRYGYFMFSAEKR